MILGAPAQDLNSPRRAVPKRIELRINGEFGVIDVQSRTFFTLALA